MTDKKPAIRLKSTSLASGSILRKAMEERRGKEDELTRLYGQDFDKPGRRFGLNRAEEAVIAEWLEELKPEILSIQRGQGIADPFVAGEPYYGAIGGGLHYTFIPTGLGDIVIVKETTTGKELNVTEALDWYFYG